MPSCVNFSTAAAIANRTASDTGSFAAPPISSAKTPFFVTAQHVVLRNIVD
jgi:hypothetical protein